MSRISCTTESVSSSTGGLLATKPLAKCFLKGKRPPARDGHSTLIEGGRMVIFGGDRHHMPFNDLYVLDLESEFNLKHDLLN